MSALGLAASHLPKVPELAAGEESHLLQKKNKRSQDSLLSLLLRAAGPGLLACLAGSDAGELFTSGDSGAKWGCGFVPFVLAMTPLVYATQELTARLGVYTKKGLTACIRERCGPGQAKMLALCLAINCFFAVTSELSGIDAVAQMWGANRLTGSLLAALALISALVLLTYKQVEVLASILGLSSLIFVANIFVLHPSPMILLKGTSEMHLDNADWRMLLAATIGCTFVPYPMFFQQSATAASGLDGAEDMAEERNKTMLGSIISQLIIVSVILSVAATIHGRRNLRGISDFVQVLEPEFGHMFSKVVISIAFTGVSLGAAFVATLAPAWAISEACGADDRCAMDQSLSDAPIFYGSIVSGISASAIMLQTGVRLVTLNVYIEIFNALCVPITLGALVFIASTSDSLPVHERLVGPYKWILVAALSMVSVAGVAAAISSL